MIVENIKRYELEITSLCNAACPMCVRTEHPENYELLSISLNDVKRMFPTKEYINNREFLLCGALGDPVVNKDCYDIVDYIILNGGSVLINTNGSLETPAWWEKMGKLSADTNQLGVWFCVDGCEETNYIYRVNTNFDIIKRSMKSYVKGGNGFANATWVYTVFDHNEKEIEKARSLAAELGMKFALRKGAGNNLTPTMSTTKKKDKETKEIKIETNVIAATGAGVHSKIEKIKQLEYFVKRASEKEKQRSAGEIVKSIRCKLIHEGELFIASDQTLWPCCFLWSAGTWFPKIRKSILKDFDENWNSLLHHSIEEILQHPWFSVILEQSWDPSHKMHLPKCIQNCAYDQAHQNEIDYDNK